MNMNIELNILKILLFIIIISIMIMSLINVSSFLATPYKYKRKINKYFSMSFQPLFVFKGM